MPEKKKWTDMEKDICYFREYTVVEMIHSPTFIPKDPDQEHDPEGVRYTPNMWCVFTRTAPERYVSMSERYLQQCMAEGKKDPL